MDIGRLKLLLFVALTVLILDQITKNAIDSLFHIHQSVEVIPGLFNITYIRNPGVAFGILRDGGVLRVILLSLLTVIAIIVICFLYLGMDERWNRVALSMIAGGALGNLVDRLRFWEVIDFLDFYIGRYHWPAFNVADSAITAGVLILLIRSFGGKGAPSSDRQRHPDTEG